MPFRSQAQRAFLYSQHPDIAKRWEKETPPGKLPKHVKKNKNTPVREHFELAQGRFRVPSMNNFKK